MEPMITICYGPPARPARISCAPPIISSGEVRAKGINNFVSDVDVAAEKEIIYHLGKAPRSRHPGRRNRPHRQRGRTLPLDYRPAGWHHQLPARHPHYAVSIACLQGKLEHAVIVDPCGGRIHRLARPRAQLNGRRIRVSQRPSLEGALLGTGIPFRITVTISWDRTARPSRFWPDSARAFAARGRLAGPGLCRGGPAGCVLGDRPGAVGYGGGALLIREAGGLVADIDSSENFLESAILSPAVRNASRRCCRPCDAAGLKSPANARHPGGGCQRAWLLPPSTRRRSPARAAYRRRAIPFPVQPRCRRSRINRGHPTSASPSTPWSNW